jgi:hypothetical protein
MLTAFVPVLSESSALGADRYFDYRIENYAEALSDAPVDHVIDTLGETAKLLSGWSDRAFALIADLICVIARYEKRTMTPF